MFIKVTSGQKLNQVYECDDYSARNLSEEGNPYEDEFVVMRICMYKRDQFGNIVSQSFIVVSNETDNVFVMNNNGETVDRIMAKKD